MISWGTALMPAVRTIAVNGRFRQTFTRMIEAIAYFSSPSQFGPYWKRPKCVQTQLMTLYVGLSIQVHAIAPIATGSVNGRRVRPRIARRTGNFRRRRKEMLVPR